MNIKINGYELDNQQYSIVIDDSKHLLVSAGAGSGKTFTILGKIYYLINIKKINPKEILCISFTNAASNSLKEKIKKEFNINMPVYTFHKLGLEIIKKNNNYEITDLNTLDYIIDKFLYEDILKSKYHLKIICKYFKIKEKDYLEFINENNKKVILLKNLISTFIHLFKANHHDIKDFIKFKKQAIWHFKTYFNEKRLLILILNIYYKYQKYLEENNEIDFDDMLIKATEIVKKKYDKKLKYIIIDEYQDTSFVRFELINEILKKTDANLFVVGDDFQSIYRFTGCDLSLFLDFSKYFEEVSIKKLENTYRNSNELVKIAGNFIMKNNKQIKKDLKSNKSIKKPIVIYYYKNQKLEFLNLIKKLSKENKNIFILGRNNKDIDYVLDTKYFIKKEDKIIYKNNTNINITYMTVHKSKGLESDIVVLINLSSSILGFPSQIPNPEILRFVSLKSTYPFDEERRLFYVALTRTKEKVYLFTPITNPSIFVKELIHDYKNEIEIIDRNH
jgi:DNA helicase-4